jgi:hypothetical protein
MTTLGTYLLTLFKQQITRWLGTSSQFLVNNLGDMTTIDQCRSIISFLIVVLDLASREKDLRQNNGRQFVDGIFTCWPQFVSLTRSNIIDDKLLIITLLTKTFIIDSRVLIVHEQFESISQSYLSFLIDKQLKLTFKTRLLDLLPFFASLDTDNDLADNKRHQWSNQLSRTLYTFTAECFPLKSTEFAVGTQDYHDYQAALKKILAAFELSSSSFLLYDFIIWMLCSEAHHRFEEEILASITRYIHHLTDLTRQKQLLERLMTIVFGNNSLFRFEHRLNALDKLLLNVFTSVRKSIVVEFYQKHIDMFVLEHIDCSFDIQSTTINNQLVNRIASYRLVDYMYTILTKDDVFGMNSSIARAFYQAVTSKRRTCQSDTSMAKVTSTIDGKELTKCVIARARAQFIDSKPMKMLGNTLLDKDIKRNLLLTLATSSFNCLISVLICTQTEGKLYKAFLFDANPSKVSSMRLI